MKMRKSTLSLLVIIICLLPFLSKAQLTIQRTVIASAGSVANSTGTITANWTAGEAVIGNNTVGSITLHSGFQQGDSNMGVAVDNPEMGVSFSVFLNPTYGELTISLQSSEKQLITCHLYDASGRRLQLNKSSIIVYGEASEQITITEQPAGIYFISLFTEKGERLGSVKVIKIQ